MSEEKFDILSATKIESKYLKTVERIIDWTVTMPLLIELGMVKPVDMYSWGTTDNLKLMGFNGTYAKILANQETEYGKKINNHLIRLMDIIVDTKKYIDGQTDIIRGGT